LRGAPLLPKLRGYFAEFLRKVSLARLSLLDSPTCVGLRYGRSGEQPTAFLDRLSGAALCPKARLDIRLSRRFSLCVPVGLKPDRRRNINLRCIDYALRPHLSSRLTLGGRTCPRKPWVYGDQNSHLVYRYSCLHSH
jgi:hypothetical protein